MRFHGASSQGSVVETKGDKWEKNQTTRLIGPFLNEFYWKGEPKRKKRGNKKPVKRSQGVEAEGKTSFLGLLYHKTPERKDWGRLQKGVLQRRLFIGWSVSSTP